MAIGLVKFSHRSNLLKVLWILTFFAFVLDVLSASVTSFVNEFGNAYRLPEFILLLCIYYFAFEGKARTAFIIIGLVYVCFFLAGLYLLQGKANAISTTVSSLVFIIFSILYFFKLLSHLPTTQIQGLPMFWVNTAVLVYFAGSFFVFLLRNYLIEVLHDNQIVYWSFHNILNILKNLLFAIGLWHGSRTHDSNLLKKI